jgi:dCMP deaminase
MIIGITGAYCAGKDIAAEYFQEKGFLHISLSDLIRNEMNRKKIKINRDSLINYANHLRKKYGPSVLSRVAINSLIPNRDYAISSIRNLFELEVLKSCKNFIHIHIFSNAKTRFERLQKRTERKEDEKIKTFEDFILSENSEKKEDYEKQQLHKVFEKPDIIIENNKTIEEFKKKLEKFLKDWKYKLSKRPNWDEYFIEIAQKVGSRSTCDRGRIGAVIVKNKHIISTGYVGAPSGLKHCDEAGHLFKKNWKEDNTYTLHCVRTTHAEANAIAQAAKYGIKIQGSTLYVGMTPCFDCAKIIINSGIKRVVAERLYHRSKESIELLKKAGIKFEVIKKEIMPYSKQK